jgi:hypothetical protein
MGLFKKKIEDIATFSRLKPCPIYHHGPLFSVINYFVSTPVLQVQKSTGQSHQTWLLKPIGVYH